MASNTYNNTSSTRGSNPASSMICPDIHSQCRSNMPNYRSTDISGRCSLESQKQFWKRLTEYKTGGKLPWEYPSLVDDEEQDLEDEAEADPATLVTFRTRNGTWSIHESVLKKDCRYFQGALGTREGRAFEEATTRVFDLQEFGDDNLEHFFFLVKGFAKPGRGPCLTWESTFRRCVGYDFNDDERDLLMKYVDAFSNLYIVADYFIHDRITSWAWDHFQSSVKNLAGYIGYQGRGSNLKDPAVNSVIHFLLDTFDLIGSTITPHERMQNCLLQMLSEQSTEELVKYILTLANEEFTRKFTQVVEKRRQAELRRFKALVEELADW